MDASLPKVSLTTTCHKGWIIAVWAVIDAEWPDSMYGGEQPWTGVDFSGRPGIGSLAAASIPALQHLSATAASARGGADHVRWDIMSLDYSTTPITMNVGGVAFASADPMLTIKLTGAGTFVAPASGGSSGAVTGGGTWETFESGISTGSGSYQATGLLSWQFANLQGSTPPFIDHIDDSSPRANGNAILRIAYSDGSEGTPRRWLRGAGRARGNTGRGDRHEGLRHLLDP